jgi:hypothetical protein
MFLVPIFCKIVKNGRYIFKMVKKNPIRFLVLKNGPFRLFFQDQLAKYLFVDPAILILAHIFCKIGKNGLYILKNYELFFYFFLKI